MIIIKYFYMGLLSLYMISICSFFCKFSLSYRIVGITQVLIDQTERDLTDSEYKAIEKSLVIRKTITNIFLFMSLLTFVLSGILFYFRLFTQVTLLKIVLVISFCLLIFLLVIKGINFVPNMPIR
jgi:hypothetical protein